MIQDGGIIGLMNTIDSANHRTARFFVQNWHALFVLIFGLFVIIPFLAPVFMFLGLNAAGKAIYTVYGFLCHQLPERSYFFFGPQISYSIPQIQEAWTYTNNPLIFRQFIGSPEMGWKVAWSDRMVSMYTSIWIFGLLWPRLRLWLKPLSVWGLLIFMAPMAVDGVSHLLSDLSAPMGVGFRSTNDWLVSLTASTFSPAFYAGDAWGSFNAWMRLISGTLFGAGVVWFGFPYLHQVFQETAAAYAPHRLASASPIIVGYNDAHSGQNQMGNDLHREQQTGD
jgi:uncharacterized membrane protein